MGERKAEGMRRQVEALSLRRHGLEARDVRLTVDCPSLEVEGALVQRQDAVQHQSAGVSVRACVNRQALAQALAQLVQGARHGRRVAAPWQARR